jgi:RNA polymerase sigma factor (sigma-70 family)
MGSQMRRGRQQRVAAFEAVVSAYEAALLRYATRLVCDPNTAQDVVQNTFLKLHRNWDEPMEPSPKLASWLYRVTHNEAIDYIRKTTRKRDLHARHAKEGPTSVAPNRGSGFAISESATLAATCLHDLSDRERELVILKIYEEKSYKEISGITGLTTGNVGYILHHAMKTLAARLKASISQQNSEAKRT